MISPKEAAELVKKTQNYEQVIRVKDFDNKHYVVEALPVANKIARGAQTTFGVDKNTGEVTAFRLNYADNLDRFLESKDVKF